PPHTHALSLHDALPISISPDENMFIVVHQCFEVYFKLLLNLVDRAIPALLAGDVDAATRRLRRAVDIQRLLVPQIQIPATMLPLDRKSTRLNSSHVTIS